MNERWKAALKAGLAFLFALGVGLVVLAVAFYFILVARF